MRQRNTAFSLLEVIITLAISSLVVGGVLSLFSNVNVQTRNASKSNNMTDLSRGIWSLMEDDLKRAGTGTNDLTNIKILYNFNDSFVSETEVIDSYYGVADASIESNGKSSITLHYFDYELGNNSMSTFVAAWDNGGTNFANESYQYINVATNDEAQAEAIAVGDFFVFYYPALFSTMDYYEPEESLTTVNTSAPYEGVILQVADITTIPATGASNQFSFAYRLSFSADTDVFINTITTSSGNMPLTSNTFATLIGSDMINPSSGHILVLNGTVPYLVAGDAAKEILLFGRRLGNSESFHRVTYFVDDEKNLVRTHNGESTIVASRVEDFNVKFGLDAPIGSTLTSLRNSDLDSYVSVLEANQWVEKVSDLGDEAKFLEYLGRFSVAAQVSLAVKASEKDSEDPDSLYRVHNIETIVKLGNAKPVSLSLGN